MATISIHFFSVTPTELYQAVCSLVSRYPECTVNIIQDQALTLQSDKLEFNLDYTVHSIHDLNKVLDKCLFVPSSTSSVPSYLLFD